MSHGTGSYPNYRYGVGLSNVGSYQVSGKPFLSGGIDVDLDYGFSFPAVTSWICISSSGPVRVGMSKNGCDSAGASEGVGFYFTIDTNGTQNSPIFNIKASEIYFSASAAQIVDVIAGLTGIEGGRIDNISPSGSNWSGSAGI